MHGEQAVLASWLLNSLSGRLKQSGVSRSGSVAVALSGGPDSLALASLVARWQQVLSAGKAEDLDPAVALVVDHRLRPDSGDEAAKAMEMAKDLGLKYKLLRVDWQQLPRAQDKLAAARKARYTLLLDAAKQLSRLHLLVAHHADDQVETFMLRFLRASGVRGLACMPQSSHVLSGTSGVSIIRPLLGFRKSDLETYCREEQIDFIEDPTNLNVQFVRNHIRSLLQGPHAHVAETGCDSVSSPTVESQSWGRCSSSMVLASMSMDGIDFMQQYNVVTDILRLQQACSRAQSIRQEIICAFLQATVAIFENHENLVILSRSQDGNIRVQGVVHATLFLQENGDSAVQHATTVANAVSSELPYGSRFAIVHAGGFCNQSAAKAEQDEALAWVLGTVSGSVYPVNSRDAGRFQSILKEGRMNGRYTGGGCFAQPIPKSRGSLCIVACLADQDALVEGLRVVPA